MDPLVQFYIDTVPQGQQVPNIVGRPNAADFIRQSNPGVYSAYQQSLTGGGTSRVDPGVSGLVPQPGFFSRTFGPDRPGRGTAPDISGFFASTDPRSRPVPSDFPYGPAMWSSMEADRLRSIGAAVPTSGISAGAPNLNIPGDPSGRLGTGFRSVLGQTGPGREFVEQYGRNPSLMETLRGAPGALDGRTPVAADGTGAGAAILSRDPFGLRDTPAGEDPALDWAEIFAALDGQGGGPGVRVDRSLFNLQETPEEAAMLAREMAEIQRRQAEGDVALRSAWGNVQTANTAAAERARAMAAQSGTAAAAVWSQAAQQARDLAAQRAQAAGQFSGRAGIDIDPEGGASDWVSFMESQAPAEQRFAERQQEILGSDLDWMAGMAGAQGEAFASDLRRQANVMSFERAREHNLRVQDRIGQERMMLAQMELQAQSTNAQLASQRGSTVERVLSLLPTIAQSGPQGPALLAAATGIPPEIAAAIARSYGSGIGGRSLEAQLNNLLAGRSAGSGG